MDEEVHCEGAAILWHLAKVQKQDVKEVSHKCHGQKPILLETQKRKRNEKDWKQNFKRQKVNSDQKYSHKSAKTGEAEIRQAWAVQEVCNKTCKRKCHDFIDKHEKKLINKNDWQ